MKTGLIYDASLPESFKKHLTAAVNHMQMNDAATVAIGGAWIEQQVREILPTIWEQKYPNKPLLNFMSVNNSGALMDSLIQRIQSFSGRHKGSHESSDTSGKINLNRTAKEQLILTYDASSEYDDVSLRRSILLNENIDSGLITSHNQSYMNMIDEIGFLGVTLENGDLVNSGLANYTNVLSALDVDSTDVFSNLSGLQIYEQIAGLYNEAVGQAGGNDTLFPKVCVLPPKQFSDISTKMMTGTSPVTAYVTVKQYLEANLGIKCYASSRMVGVAEGFDRLVLLNNAPENMQMFIPQPLQFAPINIRGFKYELFSKFRVAGVGINFANAISYLNKI